MSAQPNPDAPILLVDDEVAALEVQAALLQAEGYSHIRCCSESSLVLSEVDAHDAEVILLDLAMPGLSGEELLAELRIRHPQIPVIVVTAASDIDTAVRCMKAGAFDYMVKAVERSRFVSGVSRAVELRRVHRQYFELRKHFMQEGLAHPEAFAAIKTNDRRMESIFRFVEAIAPTRETVLVVGETGVGKELIGQAIHELSGRSGPLTAVNAAGLDDTMLSDALFGHRKGAYTGATAPRQGLVAASDEGTLFLDEVGDLSPQSQVKLLRLIETGEYLPLGSDLPRRTTARFVVATNRDLEEATAAALFRKDLYYRLAAHEIRVPPLRDRSGDIELLFEHFLGQACALFDRQRPSFPSELIDLLSRYTFPGNVRELRSMVFDAVARQSGASLSLEPFQAAIGRSGKIARLESGQAGAGSSSEFPTLQAATERLIQDAVERAGGNLTTAAKLLGISHQALSKRLRRRDLTEPPESRPLRGFRSSSASGS